MILTLALLLANLAPVPYSALKSSAPAQVQTQPPAAVAAPTTPTAPIPMAANGKPAPVLHPYWLAGPRPSLTQACVDGYLTDKSFTGEPVILVCTVQKDGGLDGCLVQESKRAQAAHLHDVAVCWAGGFRMGPVDRDGAPTTGRPVYIPMGITPAANVADATPAEPIAAPMPAKPKR